MFWDLGAVEFGAIVLAVVAGALTQGAVGIGFGLVIVPVLALIAPETLPATPLLISLPLTALIVGRERHAIDRSGLPPLFLGRILGTVAAVTLLLILTESALEILFGVVILAVAAVSLLAPDVRTSPPRLVLAGAASGLFATTASIGGPPVALLYQTRPGPELRSTLSFVFLIGGFLSLGGLVVADRLWLAHVAFAAVLALPMALGFALSRRLARFLDGGWLRPAVLAFAAGGGILAILRGLLG